MSEEFNDVHAGKGGSYLVGEDGKRVLQERTDQNNRPLPSPPLPAGERIEVRGTPKPAVKGDKNA